jgi:hypothetical protein
MVRDFTYPLSEDDCEAIRGYLEDFIGGRIRNRRIASIRVLMSYKGRPSVTIRVGRFYDDLEPEAPREQILAIFESESFLAVTNSRGALTGPPYYFTRENVREVETFE